MTGQKAASDQKPDGVLFQKSEPRNTGNINYTDVQLALDERRPIDKVVTLGALLSPV